MADKPIDNTKVTVAQPVSEGGIVFWAPKGTALPADASAALAETYESLGDVGPDGWTESTSIDKTDFKNMAGHTVLTVSDGKSRSYKITFIEAMRESLLKFINGKDNVEATAGVISHVKLSDGDTAECVLVFEELMSDGTKCRTVIDRAKITKYDDVSHSKGKLIDYGVTIDAQDNGGKCGDVWYAAPAA